MGEKILVIGGSNGATDVSDVWEYDPAVNSWSSKESMPTARSGHQIAMYNDKVWVMGGRSPVSDYLSTVEIYDPATDTWSAGPNLTIPRLWPITWVVNGELYIGGGGVDYLSYY